MKFGIQKVPKGPEGSDLEFGIQKVPKGPESPRGPDLKFGIQKVPKGPGGPDLNSRLMFCMMKTVD